MLLSATPLAFAAIGGMFSRVQRRREHRPRGDDAAGAFFGIWAPTSATRGVGLLCAVLAGGVALIHAFFAIHLRADQIVGGTAINFLALGLTGYLFVYIYGGEARRGRPRIPNVHLGFLPDFPFIGDASASST